MTNDIFTPYIEKNSRPLLLKSEDVKKVLDGKKTAIIMNTHDKCCVHTGSFLYVREPVIKDNDRYYYVADLTDEEVNHFKESGFKITTSIHMPKSACRLILVVTNCELMAIEAIEESDLKKLGCCISDEFIGDKEVSPFSICKKMLLSQNKRSKNNSIPDLLRFVEFEILKFSERDFKVPERDFMKTKIFLDKYADLTMVPMCDCGHVFQELVYNRKTNMFTPYICPKCGRYIETISFRDLSCEVDDEMNFIVGD